MHVPQLGLLFGTLALLVLGVLPVRTLGRSRGLAVRAVLLLTGFTSGAAGFVVLAAFASN